MTDREEMRRLIDVIELSAQTVSLEQAVADIKAFANTTSFLVNTLEGRLHKGEGARKRPAKAAPVRPRKPPKPRAAAQASQPSQSVPRSQPDLRPVSPQSSVPPIGTT